MSQEPDATGVVMLDESGLQRSDNNFNCLPRCDVVRTPSSHHLLLDFRNLCHQLTQLSTQVLSVA